jgi:hypothetical protein
MLHDFEDERTRGYQLRAKCMHINQNEHNTKYFFDKEKARSGAKAMTSLLLENDVIITDTEAISREQRKFYQNLYTDSKDIKSQEVNEAIKYFLESNIHIDTIDDNDKSE